eukprot:6205201-Pleurochrysis_carterae.AAC.3
MQGLGLKVVERNQPATFALWCNLRDAPSHQDRLLAASVTHTYKGIRPDCIVSSVEFLREVDEALRTTPVRNDTLMLGSPNMILNIYGSIELLKACVRHGCTIRHSKAQILPQRKRKATTLKPTGEHQARRRRKRKI